jgi:hypothetical protein
VASFEHTISGGPRVVLTLLDSIRGVFLSAAL